MSGSGWDYRFGGRERNSWGFLPFGPVGALPRPALLLGLPRRRQECTGRRQTEILEHI